MYYYYNYNSPVGVLTIASNEKNIVGLWIQNQKYYMDVLQDKECLEKQTEPIKLAQNWLDSYFNNEKPDADNIPIELIGSDFRKRVWKLLTEIPYGKTVTYGDLAKQMGYSRMSAQAVGGAVGHNPISIIVPCHRVVGSNGDLTGFAAGLDTKIKLLELEGVKL